MEIDRESFVPIRMQEALAKYGWVLTYSSFTDGEKNVKLYPDGKIGMQTWELYSEYGGSTVLNIHYDWNNEYKNVTLWYNEKDSEEFKIRNILSVLKRRELLKGEN